ncbi:beclin-1-like protein isoform X2 [Hyalella azteca]|nr:beclin-1-like protein isoform X2 [Hyalella azteca]
MAAGFVDRVVMPLTLSLQSHESNGDTLLQFSNITGLECSSYSYSDHGYTVLGCPSNSMEKTPALKVANTLLDIASTNSSIDHPLCEECTDSLMLQIEEQLHFTANKAKSYVRLLEELQQMPQPDTNRLEAELKQLKDEELALEEEIAKLLQEQKEAEKILEEKQDQAQALADEEERYQIEYCKQRVLWFDVEEERISFYNQKVHTHQQLEKLKQTNIFNIAFHIWKDDHISTINNFRLGRLPTMQVTWTEINAALGQMALLLVSLARRFEFSFSKYKIVAYGNHSYIKVLDQSNTVLPLYSHSGIKYIFDHSFDTAMTAFLECFMELVRALEQRTNTTLSLPYPIDKHCLHDPQGGARYSVKTQFTPDEQWTKALKFLLTNLKWALTWVSSPLLTGTCPGFGLSSSSRSTPRAINAPDPTRRNQR